ncbi:MAG: hypothetical protein ACOYEG_08115 [Petrimonas sp.]|jgi:hypothetical protein
MKTKPLHLAFLSIAFFYIGWGVSQLIGIKMHNSLLSSLLFSFVFTGLIGTFIPIYFKNIFNWKYKKSSSNKIAGYFFLILAVIFSTLLSGAFVKVIELNYSWNLILKYVLLFFPMSLGIGLFAFLLIPNVIYNWEKSRNKSILLIASISIFFFISFYVDSLFQDIELAATMGVIGLLLGVSYLFLRNFWIIYLALFIIMIVNTLADNKYDEYSYGVVIVSTLLSLAILMYDFRKNRNLLKE